MPAVNDVVDKFAGMITHEQAQDIIKNMKERKNVAAKRQELNAFSLIKLSEEWSKMPQGSKINEPRQIDVEIKDVIYRIFNPSVKKFNLRESITRSIAIGEYNNTVKMTMGEKLSDIIDASSVERGDTVMIKNAKFDMPSGEIRSVPSTFINRLQPSSTGITDFSKLTAGMRNADVIGVITEIDSIRYVNSFKSNGQIASSRMMLSDGINAIGVSCWGASALYTAELSTNDAIKIEFCNIIARNGRIEAYADNLSRMLKNNAFKRKLGIK